MNRQETTGSWTYSTTTFRQANANTANQLTIFNGLLQGTLAIRQLGFASLGGAGACYTGIGIDSTTTVAVPSTQVIYANAASGVSDASATAELVYPAPLGYHKYCWLESGGGGASITWYGANLSGIRGTWWA
jgi:hypothetical protein